MPLFCTMVEKQSGFLMFLLKAVITLCYVMLATASYMAQSPAQVISLLNYTVPMDYAKRLKFLKDVRNSEIGLCLNLTGSQTGSKSIVAETLLVSLHVRLTNFSSTSMTPLQFPCTTCTSLVPRTPLAKLVLRSGTLPNVSCLAASRFPDYFEAVVQDNSSLSDVLSLSLFDPHNSKFVNLTAGDVIQLEIPLATPPNNSYNYLLECLSQERNTSTWSNASCSTNQSTKLDNNTHFVQCNCSTLGSFAVFVQYFTTNNANGNAASVVTAPNVRISLALDVSCDQYLSNATTKADFLNTTTYTVASSLNTSVSNIINMEAKCGSIVVNFTLLSRDGTNETLNKTVMEFVALIRSDSFQVMIDNTKLYPLTLKVFDLTSPGLQTFMSPYFYRKFATTPTTEPTETQQLVVDYKPFVIGAGAVIFAVIFCVCFSCVSHSWYLRKKKYTEFNSDKVEPKVIVPLVKEQNPDAAPPEFPMTYTQRPQVDERQMTKYDWARTSFAQGESTTSAYVTDEAELGPRLIVDGESDEDAEVVSPAADIPVTMETGDECEIESDYGEGGSLGDGDTRPGSYKSRACEDSFHEAQKENQNMDNGSREGEDHPTGDEDISRETVVGMRQDTYPGMNENTKGDQHRKDMDEDTQGSPEADMDLAQSPGTQRRASSAASSELREGITNQGMPQPSM